jgi:L-alanine-DL-glutamate epimerase-like enolase superfamily enzyme
MSSPATALRVTTESHTLKEPFNITGHRMTTADVVVVTLERDGYFGCGEAAGVFYLPNNDPASLIGQIESVRSQIEAGRVQLIEQPFPIGQDGELANLRCPIAIAADESVQHLSDVAGLVDRYEVINIKLDKCGGLTEGLAMAREARRLGMSVMVGNMLGTSLAMAPAFLLGQLCDVVDLDGPVFLRQDRVPAVQYNQGMVTCPSDVWGGPAAG